ncbi:MAG TPA: glycoside hydrolase family 27 protein [Terriglobales bacterium]|nr:glycoside hydrolase family 27 protein [Terriglobales bacterium]
MKQIFLCLIFTASCFAADLTGNWVVESPRNDGTTQKTYFNLKQDGDRISGTIRVTQFYYTISESSGNSDGFTITGTMKDGKNDRHAVYQGKLIGDELHLSTRRRPNAPLTNLIAHRAPAGEGVMPPRIDPPPLRPVRDNGLARTPPMGWNSWNYFKSRVDDQVVREIADAMVSSGMRDAGYQYINIDDTWEAGRDAEGNIQTNKKFPDMKALADYVHSKGLKLGIYSSPGPNTCAGYEGSYEHEAQDAKTYAKWGIDYLKYDWCGARNLYTDEEMQAVYQKMGDALLASGRPIVYSLCQYGRNDVWKWGPAVGGNLWRTTGDIRDAWDSMSKIGFNQADLAQFAFPGHWNDPDMLEVGNGGMTDTEYKTHMSLWSLLAAPLLAGNDIRNMTPATRDILTDREVIAIDQDKAGKQATRVSQTGDQEIWVRELANGDKAIGLFNREEKDAEISFSWTQLGIKQTPKKLKVRDLWNQRDLGAQTEKYSTVVPRHGVVLLRVGLR